MAPEPEDIKVEFSQTGTNGTADTFVMQNAVDLATASYTITNFIVGEDEDNCLDLELQVVLMHITQI